MNQKTVLVTGSARGIGKAIAIRFAKAGYNVIINGKQNLDALCETEKEILQYSACFSYLGDVGNYTVAKDLIERSIERFKGIDVLINNAGISYIGLLTDMTIADWNTIITSNLTSVFNCSNIVLPYMISNKAGKIINISSVWGSVGASCEVAYSATKGGMNAFTKALAKEVGPSNIQVNAIACGAIHTDMNGFLSEEDVSNLIEEIPANRMGTCNEVADFALQIATNNDYLNGQVIHFDGGWI